MVVMADTTALHEIVYVDGRHSAEKQWATIAEAVARAYRHRSQPVSVTGAYVMTDNPNHRPYFTPGQKLKG